MSSTFFDIRLSIYFLNSGGNL